MGAESSRALSSTPGTQLPLGLLAFQLPASSGGGGPATQGFSPPVGRSASIVRLAAVLLEDRRSGEPSRQPKPGAWVAVWLGVETGHQPSFELGFLVRQPIALVRLHCPNYTDMSPTPLIEVVLLCPHSRELRRWEEHFSVYTSTILSTKLCSVDKA